MKRIAAAILVLAVMAGGPADAKTKTTKEPVLYPGRPGAQKKDRERLIGKPLELSGWTTTVNQVVYKKTVSTIDTDGYLVATITLVNRDKKSQTYNLFDWQIQTPAGQLVNANFTGAKGVLNSASLINGGTVTADVIYQVGKPAPKGKYYVVWKPDAFNDDRGLWEFTV